MRFRVSIVVVALATLVLLAACGGSSSSSSSLEPEGAADAEEAALADAIAQERLTIQGALDQFNQSDTKAHFASLRVIQGSSIRCSAGFSADFPDMVLLSAISSAGFWVQVNVSPETGVDRLSLNRGDDYRLAGFDETFWANGYPCSMDDEGNISLL